VRIKSHLPKTIQCCIRLNALSGVCTVPNYFVGTHDPERNNLLATFEVV